MPTNNNLQRTPVKGLLCWDIDGVLIDELPWKTDWRDSYSPEARALYQTLNNDERWQACLRGESRACDVLGLLTLESKLPSDLPEQVLRLWHGREVGLNTPLVALMKAMGTRGWRNIIASNQDKDRAEILQRFLPIKELVEAWGFSCRLGAAKPAEDFFKAIMDKFGEKGMLYVMIDDVLENLKAPNKLGWKTHHYKNIPALTAYLENL
jgi:HAD superfamily hydrolase (TIGR01509 family)